MAEMLKKDAWYHLEIGQGPKEAIDVVAQVMEVGSVGSESVVKLRYRYKGSGKQRPVWKVQTFPVAKLHLFEDAAAPDEDAVTTFRRLKNGRHNDDCGIDAGDVTPAKVETKKVPVVEPDDEKPSPKKPATKPVLVEDLDDPDDVPVTPPKKPATKPVAVENDPDDPDDVPAAKPPTKPATKPVVKPAVDPDEDEIPTRPAPKKPVLVDPDDPDDPDDDEPPARPSKPAAKPAPKKPVFEDDDPPDDDPDDD